jgi:hypothetical protein
MKIFVLAAKLTTVALLFSAVLALGKPAAAADAECRDMPTSHLKVYVAGLHALTVIPTTQSEMAAASDDESVVADWKVHPLLLIAPGFASQVAIDERTVSGDGGAVCAAPSDVRVRLGINDYLVYIDNDAQADDCVREVLVQHATAHLAADNKAIAAFVAQSRDTIAKQVSHLKRVPYADEQTAVASFKAGLSATLVGMLDAFRRERPRVYADANTSLEQSEFETVCNGRLKALESDARFLGKRADATVSGRAKWLADGVGFEPTVSLRPRRFSRPVP